MSEPKSQDAELVRQSARNQRMKDLFGSAVGKRVLQDIFEAAGMDLAENPQDSHSELAFHAGERRLVLWILTCTDEGSQGVIDRLARNYAMANVGVQQEVQQ